MSNSFEQFLEQARKKLRMHPVDLRKENLCARLERYRTETSRWSLLWGLAPLSSAVVDFLWEWGKASGIFSFLESIHAGEKCNSLAKHLPSEWRGVFHLTARSFVASDIPDVEKERLFAIQERERIASYCERGSWSALLVVGIGGSHLGLEALWVAFSSMINPLRPVYFLSSCDPAEIDKVLKSLDLTTTLVAIISKSGATEEVVWNDAALRAYFQQKGLIPREHFLAVTVQGTLLDDEERFHSRFYFSQGIGGRFCVSSAPGALVIGFSFGMAVFLRFLQGANTMDTLAFSSDRAINIPLWMALLSIWNRNVLEISSTCILPYIYGLRYFSDHLQQLAMESNGKRIDRTGSAVSYATASLFWGSSGTNFQHSFGQWLHQSPDLSSIEILCAKSQDIPAFRLLLSNAFGQAIALAQGKEDSNPNRVCLGNRPVLILLAKEWSCESLGELWSLYEHRVMFEGFFWGINSFDQEGVQLGKTMARQLTRDTSDLQRFFEANFFV